MQTGPADRRQPRPIQAKRPKDRTVHDLLSPKRVLGFRADWREYFRDFCARHGGNPVETDGRLTLPDGWQYSSTDYAGPEYPPPTDPAQLRALVVGYWRERRGIVADEIKLIESERRSWRELVLARDGELKHRHRARDEDTGRWQVSHDLVTDRLRDVDYRLKWLRDDLAFSEENARRIGDAPDSELLREIERAVKPREVDHA